MVDTTYTADQLVNEILLGSGVVVGNVTFKGEKHAISYYEDQTSQLRINKGILLTSGNAYFALGPNKSPRTGWASSAPGDEELESIARGKTWDAAVLEFDFVTISENLDFRFVFASEEYLEYVGSKFNDVFAFFITDPNGNKMNIARLPDGRTPITVNTVNNELNAEYYIDNTYHNVSDPFIWDVRNRKVISNENYLKDEVPPKYDTQFDGFTTVLVAHAKVIPNQLYHIKIGIADVGDGILDSGVFLEGGSFRSYGDEVVTLADHFNRKTQVSLLAKKEADLVTELALPNIKIPNRQSLGKIEFDFDKSDLTPMAQSHIIKLYQNWNDKPNAKIELVGHTDSFGSHEYNIDLSHNRVEAVSTMLQQLGVPKNRIVMDFKGENFPVLSNDSPVGRARNRRVEFYLVY